MLRLNIEHFEKDLVECGYVSASTRRRLAILWEVDETGKLPPGFGVWDRAWALGFIERGYIRELG